jgi:hypothetical protein
LKSLPVPVQSFVHRPKVLSVAEARAQKKVLMNVSGLFFGMGQSFARRLIAASLLSWLCEHEQRSSELLKIADAMASGIIDFTDDVHTRSERRKRQKIDRGEMNRFRVLVDMLEKDLETFQLSDPAEYRKHYNPLVPFAKLIAGIIAILMSTVWILQIILFMITAVPLDPFMNTYLLVRVVHLSSFVLIFFPGTAISSSQIPSDPAAVVRPMVSCFRYYYGCSLWPVSPSRCCCWQLQVWHPIFPYQGEYSSCAETAIHLEFPYE